MSADQESKIDVGQKLSTSLNTGSAKLKERRHAEFFDVINASLNISCPEQFCAWVQNDLQHIFPHAMLACGFGLFENEQAIIEKIITCNFPQAYLDGLNEAGGMSASPVVQQWAQTRRPVLFEPEGGKDDTPWMENFHRFGLRNIAAHGLCDLNSHSTSYFSFFNIPIKLTSRHAQLLEMLIPHLHVALMRTISNSKPFQSDSSITSQDLTKREKEILRWLSSGKTNAEIAKALCISENTVKNHVQRILAKLKVSTRTEAVAKGMVKHY